jgi:hypothetical protein
MLFAFPYRNVSNPTIKRLRYIDITFELYRYKVSTSIWKRTFFYGKMLICVIIKSSELFPCSAFHR